MAPNEDINSHSIPQRNLKYLSTNKEVHILKKDLQNPFKKNLDKMSIKSTLTFLGFCSYHDNETFKYVENNSGSNYDNHKFFLIAYRALAKNYTELRESIERLEWDLKTWNCKERRQLIIQTIKFKLDPYIVIKNKKNGYFTRIKILFHAIRLLMQYKYLLKLSIKKELRFF